MASDMSELYFCIFCDTIVTSVEESKEHYLQHFCEDNQRYQTMTVWVNDYIEKCLINYSKQVNVGFKLRPKCLPKKNVSDLLIGCPVCDAIIRTFDLKTYKQKNRCFCGSNSQALVSFQCIDCRQSFHFECDYDLTQNRNEEIRCRDCCGKDFSICMLRSETYNRQLEHIHKHLNYYPIVCHFETESNTHCDQRFTTITAIEAHLEADHGLGCEASDDFTKTDRLIQFYEYEPIERINLLIENRLNGKYLTARGLDSAESAMWTPMVYDVNRNQSNDSPIAGFSGNQYRGPELIPIDLSHRNSYSTNEFNDTYLRQPSRSMVSNVNYRGGDYASNQYSNDNNGQQSKPRKTGFKAKAKQLFHRNNDKNQCRKEVLPQSRAQQRSDYTLTDINLTDSLDEDSNQMPFELNSNENLFSDGWFRQSIPSKFPYFPQKDDEVVYIPYGQELYKEEVHRRGLYNQSNRGNSIRFYPNDAIHAKVSKIDFEFKQKRNRREVRLVYITLRPNDRKYGTIIHVKYHDLKNVIDFIVLKEYYDSAVNKSWQTGDQFRAIVDDKYWFGTIIGFNQNEYSLTSHFKKYEIQWANNETEWLSPWDLEEFDTDLDFDRTQFIGITNEDRKQFFTSQPDEWPQMNEKRELKRIAEGLKMIAKHLDEAKEFNLIDDINSETGFQYRDLMTYPIDLKTIIARVENKYYRRHSAIKYDLKFIEANVRKLIKRVKKIPEFRFPDKMAKKLKYNSKFVTALCLIFCDSHDVKNPLDLYHNIDDYLENHDVKCYSAKRVHLNAKKKNCYLPVVWRRTADYVSRRGKKSGQMDRRIVFSPAMTYAVNRKHLNRTDQNESIGRNQSDVYEYPVCETDTDTDGDPDFDVRKAVSRKFNYLSNSYNKKTSK